MGKQSLSIALCLALLSAALPGYTLNVCSGMDPAGHACKCRGLCACGNGTARTGPPAESNTNRAQGKRCSACVGRSTPVDRVGLLPFLYRSTSQDTNCPEPFAISRPAAKMRGRRVAPLQSDFSQVDVFLRECSFLS
jgi:hypothetical protein